MEVQTSNVELNMGAATGANRKMRLESEVRKPSILEQRYTHGKWRIVKIFVRGRLSEIIVNHREEQAAE